MSRELGTVEPGDPWIRIGWWSAAVLVGVSVVLGFIVLGRYQLNDPSLDTWSAICRAIGIPVGSPAAGGPQPPLRVPTRVAWTGATLAQVASGNEQNGAFVALNCGACHGDQGVSSITWIPTLAGMNAAALYKQLDDYRSGKRFWGVMNAMATALSAQDSADVAAYFSKRTDGLSWIAGRGVPESGRSLRQRDPTIRLVFAGDPGRGIPPCASCHGPAARKLGAPVLQGQQVDYIERQLGAFAQGIRQNDINEQMRAVALQLTPDEMHSLARFYGISAAAQAGQH